MEKLVVTREAIEAYERRTGFVGIGEFFLRKGLFVLADNSEKQKTKVGSPRTSTSSTTSGAEEPKLSSPYLIKNVWVTDHGPVARRTV